MDSPARPSPGALGALQQIAASPYGPLFFSVLGDMLAARDADGAPCALDHTPRQPADVLAYLAEHATEVDLFAAMRLLESAFRHLPRLGEARRPKEEPIRIGQEVALAFAPSPVAELEPAADGRPPKLLQRVLGLFGPNGALPNHLTEYVYERTRHGNDRAFAAFADLFHHRATTLFYRAWAASQPAVGLDRPHQDRFGDHVAALCGLGLPALRKRDSVPDLVKLAHVGLLGRHVRNPEGLKALLANHFRVEVKVLGWMGYWMRIPTDQQTRLGMADGFATLGEQSVAGECVWDAQTAFRIVIGPLAHERYLDFLPNGASLPKLMSLVRLYAGDEYRFDVQLVLKKEEVPLSWLGNDVLLGWTSWLGVRLESSDATDYLASGAGAK